MIRTSGAAITRRGAFRRVLAGAATLAGAELAATFLPFFRVQRLAGLGAKIAIGPKADLVARFAETGDTPILNLAGRFFLLHAPGGIIAAYRKCTHLGCTVPWNAAEDRFHCPCHGSLFDKRTAVVTGSPAPRPLQLFHIVEQDGGLVVDTNPLNVIDRTSNVWDPRVLEVLL